MTRKSNSKSAATDPVGLELIGFGSGSAPLRSLSAKVGEKPKGDPKDDPWWAKDGDKGENEGDEGDEDDGDDSGAS